MRNFPKHSALARLAAAVLLLALGRADAASETVSIAAGARGLTALQFGGDQLLSNGDFAVQKVTLTRSDGHRGDGSLTPEQTEFDVHRQKLRQTFDWGVVSCTYAVAGNRLSLTVGVHNTSTSTLSGLQIQLLTLNFPQAPKDWVSNYVYMGANISDPTINYADYGSGALAVCNDDVERPLLVGFPGRQSLQVRPLWVCSSNIGWLSPMLDPYLKRPIAPGGFDTYHVSLRFGPPTASGQQLAADVVHKFAAAYPFQLHWADRRAIGTLHLAVSETKYHSATNPRGWFMDPQVDVTTPAGIAAFHARVLAYADASVKILKQGKAQGMITWDLEGEEYPQATTYIGDPRLLKVLDPEMDSVADAYFQKFRDAGLRTGLCIRPQRLVHTPTKTDQQELTDPVQVVQTLYDKIAYAHKRWGCTLFYVDSNGDPNVPYDPAIFQRLTERLKQTKIEALVMPEHQDTRYYAYTAPYDELRLGVTTTPSAIRAVYPQAFTAIYAPDGPIALDHDALVGSVRRGDILLFRAWWDDPQNALVQSVYHDAGK